MKWILYLLVTISLNGEKPMEIAVGYNKPFESRAACEAAVPAVTKLFNESVVQHQSKAKYEVTDHTCQSDGKD